MSGVLIALYLVALICSAAALWAYDTGPKRFPWATVVTLVAVGVPTLIQLIWAPGLLNLLERNGPLILEGQWWRLISAFVVQDGALPGAVFNVVTLAVVGREVERLLGSARWILVAVLSVIGGELWGLIVQPVGAGNSIANFGLAAASSVLLVRVGSRRARVLAGVALLACAVLLFIGDIHGGAALVGGVTGGIVTARFPSQASP